MTLEEARAVAAQVDEWHRLEADAGATARRLRKQLQGTCPHEWGPWTSNGYENGEWRTCNMCEAEE